MKTLLIIHFFVFAAFCLNAQEVVSSAGETQTIPGVEISWTIGELVIETNSSNSILLTQGFHQSKLTVTAIDELLSSDFELKVYPNPTSEFVIIYSNNLDGKSSYSLFDLSGKLLERKTIFTTETKVNLKNFAGGTYLLRINDNNKEHIQTFKIVKED